MILNRKRANVLKYTKALIPSVMLFFIFMLSGCRLIECELTASLHTSGRFEKELFVTRCVAGDR